MTVPNIKSDSGLEFSHFTFYTKGGMGEIYKGVENVSGQEVAIKLIPISDKDDEELLMRELDACLRFSHKNIAETYTTGKIFIDGSNYLYILQKYYPAGNLRSLVKENIPMEKCLSMMMDILSGMQEMHKVIVHRDLKPENVLVDNDRHLRITDFGLAKYIDEKTRTRSFKGAGTIPYMAHEVDYSETI